MTSPISRCFAVALGVCALFFATACEEEDECRGGEHTCDGNVALYCDIEFSDSWAPYVWKRTECEGRCIDGDDEAFCATKDETLDALCPSEWAEMCHENAVLTCSQGYATGSRACPTGTSCFTREDCIDGTSCVRTRTKAYCAFGTEPEPRCDHASGFCDGETVVLCLGGFVNDATLCGTCVRGDGTPCEAKCTETESDGYVRVSCSPLDE